MKVKKIRYCANCQSEIDPHIEITEDYVVQTCPQCGHEVGRAGAFIVYPMLSNIKATIKVEAVE